ncbi:MAG: hypothetical protein HRU21_02385 [Pseudomonadales bacterium]|nr:hypothetical protein [Pseudomonadales bacterium]
MLFTKLNALLSRTFLIVLGVYLAACAAPSPERDPDNPNNQRSSRYENITPLDQSIDMDRVEYADGVELPDDSINYYDQPQYADAAESEGMQSDTAADASIAAVSDQNINPYDNPVYADNAIMGGAVLPRVDPIVQFGPNPYIQNAPYVTDAVIADFNAAVTALEADDSARAADIFERLSQEQLLLSGPAYNRAVIAYQQQDYVAANQWVDIAINRNALNFDAKNLKATLLRRQAKFTEAEAVYRDIIQAWGGYLPAYKNLGILLDLYMGKSAEALRQYRLYDQFSSVEDKQVEGWIAILSRQLEPAAPQTSSANQFDTAYSDTASIPASNVEGVESVGSVEPIDSTESAGSSDSTESSDGLAEDLMPSDDDLSDMQETSL